MLHEFIASHRDQIIQRIKARGDRRVRPSVSTDEPSYGAPLFLTHLAETLRREATDAPFPHEVIGSTASRHGGELEGAGFNVSDVVQDYGDICQVITELAGDQQAPITVKEFHTLNHCLDTAISGAVTEHARAVAETRTAEEAERLGSAAHELRDILNNGFLAFHVLKGKSSGVDGAIGEILGRSLTSLREVIDRQLSNIRLAAGSHRRERLPIATLLDEIAAIGLLHAERRQIQFTIEPVDFTLAIVGDPQLITSAVMNLLHNAFKATPQGGHVILRAFADSRGVVIEIADECGGFPEGLGDPFEPFGERRGRDGSGLGLGLSIARKAIRAHGGDIHIRNLPGRGCVFVIDLPLAGADVPAS